MARIFFVSLFFGFLLGYSVRSMALETEREALAESRVGSRPKI